MAHFVGMRELVVPLDGHASSARALPVAGSLASALGAGVRLFSVASTGAAGERAAWMREAAAHHLPDADPVIDVAAGADPVAAIVTAAGEMGVVCMATAASLRPHHGHVGSVAEGVARELGRPMIVVGPEAEPSAGPERVVVPVDGSKLSETALAVGAELSSLLGASLWVVTVVSHKAEAAAAAMLGREVVATESGYVQRLSAQAAASHDVDGEFEVLHHADAAAAIVDFLGDAGIAVMSTHGRSGLSRLFAGSVTTAVVARSHRPVVVWRPRYSSPAAS